MLQKNKCCNDCSGFERSERVFQDKMDTWRNCGCAGNNDSRRTRNDQYSDSYDYEDEYTVRRNRIAENQNEVYGTRCNHCECRNYDADEANEIGTNKHDYCDDDDTNGMALAMAYVRSQRISTRTVKNCDDALEAGTMFDELEKPFTATGGDHCDTY